MNLRLSRRTVLMIGLALCALAIPASALAATTFPKFKKKLIDPNVSLAGLKLNVNYAAAIKELGTSKGGGCKKATGCRWGTEASGEFSFYMIPNKAGATPVVTDIVVSAPEKLSATEVPVYSFTGPLMKLKTSKKIGLGSSAKAVKKAYPHAKGVLSKKSGEYTIYGKGSPATRPNTTFVISNSRVIQLDMASRPIEG